MKFKFDPDHKEYALTFTEPLDEVAPKERDPYLDFILKNYSNLLTETVNFGSHVIKWDLEKLREGKDNHIPTLFFRNVLELVDGISALVSYSSIDPSKQLVRSLFETNLNLKYLLEKDEKKRAYCFMVWRAKNQIRTSKRYLSEYSSSKELLSKLSKDPLDFGFEKYIDLEKTRTGLKSKIEILKDDRFRHIASEYERTKKIIRRNPPWYSLFDGPRNVEALAYHFKQIYLYEFTYRDYSNYIHSMHVTKGFTFVKGEKDAAQIIQIRDFQDCKRVAQFVINSILECLRFYVSKRLPEKSTEVTNWYTRFWEINQEIMSIPFNYRK